MKLQTIVLANLAVDEKENLKIWMKEISQEYEVQDCAISKEEPEASLETFFREKKLSKSKSLLLSSSRRILMFAKELNVAVLPCSDGKEDYSGFHTIVEKVWETDCRFLRRCYEREWRLPWEILETKHLIVREETEADVESLYEMYEQPHIKEYLEPLYEEREKEIDYIQKYRDYVYSYYEFGLWHLVDKQTNKSVGRAGLNPKSYEDGVSGVELGYMIAEPFLRRGYCMEACQGILQYAKEELGIEEVYCVIRPDNETSIHIAEKLGFEFEKEFTEEKRKMFRFYKAL